jgi:hypothetical protein
MPVPDWVGTGVFSERERPGLSDHGALAGSSDREAPSAFEFVVE